MDKYSQFTEDEKRIAYDSLNDYIDIKVLNDSTGGVNWGVIEHTILNQTKKQESLKRSVLNNVDIVNCQFINCAMTGSHFSKVNFFNTNLDGNNFLSSFFLDCKFHFDEMTFNIINNSLSQCQFFNCSFKNIIFSASTISQTLFSDCEFDNCRFESVTLEHTKFINCELNNVDMTELNIEFTKFVDSNFINVGFPFYQFYYIIGSKEILNKNEDIFFKAGEKKVSVADYIKLNKDLIVYYAERKAYYPITNILLSENNVETASNSLYDGIALSLQLKDFRMIKHFCHLGKEYSLIDGDLSHSILSQIDDWIIKENENKTSKNNVLEQMMVYSAEIRQLLMRDSVGKQTLQFSVETNISQKDTRKINKLQNRIQKILDKYGYGADLKFIEVRHNSPYELFIQVVSDAETILSLSFMIINIVKSFGKKIIFYKNRKKPLESIKKVVAKKYEKYVDVLSEDKINLMRKNINSYIEDLKNKAKKNKGKLTRHINSISQKILGEIDSTFPNKQYVIFTTKSS
ncbi:MAG: pentapeptide repeat-containing protein [Clostridia bacterium]|nr:pentapeptide repeat-containing protein [Clostridia bacterium]